MSISDSARFARAEREYLEPPDDDDVECDARDCNDGKVDESCDFCEGVGTYQHSEEIAVQVCEDCNGTGIYKADCSECDGSGLVDRAKARRDFLEAKGEYEYQAYKDRKAEES